MPEKPRNIDFQFERYQAQLSSRFGMDFTATEASAYESIHMTQDTSITEYAQMIVEHQSEWKQSLRRRPKIFVRIVDEYIGKLIEESTEKDVMQSRDLLVDYGKGLIKKGREDGYGDFITWNIKLRILADLSNYDSPGATDILSYSNFPDSEKRTYSNVQFWQEVYSATANKYSSASAMTNYIFGPDIEDKDPAVLMDVVDRMQQEPIEQMFPGSYLIQNRNPEKLVRIAYDNFQGLLEEAKASGWNNAQAIQKLFLEAPKREVPLHSLMIMAGNNVAEILKSNDIEDPKLQSGKQSIYDLENLPEAVNRCMYLIFELGKKPADSDPLNYLITGQILGALGPATNRLLRKSK